MFVEINGKTYLVKFRREGTTTFALLFRVEKDEGLVPLMGVGVASLYFKDRFEKAKGRKVALADLLWKYSIPDSEGEIPEGIDKETREKIWIEYFKQFKK